MRLIKLFCQCIRLCYVLGREIKLSNFEARKLAYTLAQGKFFNPGSLYLAKSPSNFAKQFTSQADTLCDLMFVGYISIAGEK